VQSTEPQKSISALSGFPFPGSTKEQYYAAIAASHPADGKYPEGQIFHALARILAESSGVPASEVALKSCRPEMIPRRPLSDQARASRIMLNGVSVAFRTLPNPPSVKAWGRHEILVFRCDHLALAEAIIHLFAREDNSIVFD
jgi:hypothetical protein